MSLSDEIKELVQFTNGDYNDVMRIREALLLMADSKGSGGILSKTFTLDANDIENNLPMMLELEPSGDCIITSVVYDFKTNGGAGITYFGTQGINIGSGNTYSDNPTNVDYLKNLAKKNNIDISNEYEVNIQGFVSIDPLTTLEITILYYINQDLVNS